MLVWWSKVNAKFKEPTVTEKGLAIARLFDCWARWYKFTFMKGLIFLVQWSNRSWWVVIALINSYDVYLMLPLRRKCSLLTIFLKSMMSVAYLQILGARFSFFNAGVDFFFLHYNFQKKSNIFQIPAWIHIES